MLDYLTEAGETEIQNMNYKINQKIKWLAANGEWINGRIMDIMDSDDRWNPNNKTTLLIKYKGWLEAMVTLDKVKPLGVN